MMNNVSFREHIPQSSVEAINEGVLHGLSRRDTVPADLDLIGPGEESRCWSARLRCRSPRPWVCRNGDQAIELARDPLAGMRDIGNGSRAFPDAVVDNGKNAEAPPLGELIACRHDNTSDNRAR